MNQNQEVASALTTMTLLVVVVFGGVVNLVEFLQYRCQTRRVLGLVSLTKLREELIHFLSGPNLFFMERLKLENDIVQFQNRDMDSIVWFAAKSLSKCNLIKS